MVCASNLVMAKPPKLPTGRGIPLHADSIQFWAERQKQLRRNLPRWNQFRSSLDAIRQTHRAIEAYNRSNGELSEDERFLAIYGLLQALVVQQDAMCHLTEALGTKPVHMNRHKRLEEIRNIRNWTVGHPTKIDRYDTHSHHAIQRPQLGRGGFSLYSAFDDGREQYTYVPLVQLARLQRRVVTRVLRDVLRELNSGELKPVKQVAGPKPAAAGKLVGKAQPTPGVSGRHKYAAHRGKADRRGATEQGSPGLQCWRQDRFRPESRRDDTNRRHPLKSGRGTPARKPPQFLRPSAVNRNNKKAQKGSPSGISPLPGERFARQRPAA